MASHDIGTPVLGTEESISVADGELAANLIEKVDAGTQLIYALYHHPRAKELMVGAIGDVFWSNGLREAYMRAQSAYGIRRSSTTRETED